MAIAQSFVTDAPPNKRAEVLKGARDEREPANNDRGRTHPLDKRSFLDRQLVVVATSGCCFVLSPGRRGAVRQR